MPALVHTIETSDGAAHSTSYRSFKAQKHSSEISRIREIYSLLGKDPDGQFLMRFDACRSWAWFLRHKESGKVRVKSSACHIRWCPLCGESRQQFLTLETKSWLDRQKFPKLLTLTLKHDDLDLSEQINHLYASFQKLRKRKFFKDRVSGGIWFFQVKKSKTDQMWHPHLHILISGKFLLHGELVKIWKELTGTSEIVDIRKVENNEKSAKHIARYATKPGDVTRLSLADACEMVNALKGRRLVGVFGNAKKVLLKPPPTNDKDDWEEVGSWSFVVGLSCDNERAAAIFNAYVLNVPLADGNSVRELERQVFEVELNKTRPPPQCDPTFYDIGF